MQIRKFLVNLFQFGLNIILVVNDHESLAKSLLERFNSHFLRERILWSIYV